MATRVRGMRETGASVLGFSIVLAALISIDPRVRTRFWNLFEDPTSGALEPVYDRVSALFGVIWEAARDQSIDNAPLLLFTVVGVVLVSFMFRT